MSETLKIEVPRRGLFELDVRPTLPGYFADILSRRHFILADARARAFQDARDFVLGKFWLLVQPMLQAATYGIIFGVLLQTSRGIDNFIGFLIIGITFFGFLLRTLDGGSGLIRTQRALIKSFNFPRATLVIGRVLRMAIDATLPAFVAVFLAVVLQWGQPIHWTIVLVPLIYVLVFVFGCGLMFITARLTAFFPDARVLIQIGGRFWFYGSCVFFPITRLEHIPAAKTIVEANPGYVFIDSIRECVLHGNVPSLSSWLVMIGWTVLAFLVGIIYFWLAEERYVEVKV